MLTTLFIIGAIVSGFVWISIFLRALYIDLRLIDFSTLKVNGLSAWPRLSIIIPACNESATIASAINTLLEIDYPNLEIILINDRSTDATGDIINQLSEKDSRIIPVHIKELPDGWLGKVHALYQGEKLATGSWLLLMDADIFFHKKDTLKKAIAYAESKKIDNFSLIPCFKQTKSILLEITLLSMSVIALYLFKFTSSENAKSKKSTAVGAFNLVRRSLFAKSKGFEWLKMEPVDDIGLSQLIKENKGRIEVMYGANSISVEWYPDFYTLTLGLEKNGFALFNYNNFIFFTSNLIFILLVIGPLLGLLTNITFLHYWPLLIYFLTIIIGYKVSQSFKRANWASFFIPIGFSLFGYALIRSTILFWVRGGVYWRDSFYPGKLLKENQRVKI